MTNTLEILYLLTVISVFMIWAKSFYVAVQNASIMTGFFDSLAVTAMVIVSVIVWPVWLLLLVVFYRVDARSRKA